ncbi:hypothetical protein GCM10027445_10340 [Amycolatopsis endophytica]|uniref:MFS family permease n=1 Tax=Amycolatopsis endophytica TaxID=860233 RepID=A0A853AXA5_9PSEU|nr:MFS transporter [Amycolatopsis endophytica]NYI87269.1 MFS family permease [Amycolatopsis endophytica]
MKLPRPYWRLWSAAAVDNVGDGAFTAAVPLLAAQLTHRPVLVSAVSAASYAPWLVFSLPFGALVDRYDRRRLMVLSQITQTGIMAFTALAVVTGWFGIGLLVAMAFTLGACEVVFGNAAQAIVPDLVAPDLLHRANGYQNTVTYLGQQFLGPPVGSALFTVAAAAPFGLNAVSFAGSAVLIAGLPRITRTVTPRPLGAAIKDGLRWLWRHRRLRTLALLLGVNTFCFAMGTSTLVLLATHTLHATAAGYGVLLAAAAVGGAIGGLVNARLVAWLGALPALLLSLGGNVVAFLAIGAAPALPALAALLAVSGFATTIWNVLALTLRQQQVPDDLRGRVNSVYRMIGWGLMPLGALAGGAVAAALGTRAPFPVAGAIRGVALLAALPVLLRDLRHPGD